MSNEFEDLSTTPTLTLDPFQPQWFFAAGFGLVAVYALSMWRWGMNEEERDLVRRPLARIFRAR